MRALGPLVLTAVLLAASGCGSDSPETASYDDAGCNGKGQVVARADLDGDGTDEPVRLIGPGPTQCADTLLASAVKKIADVDGLDLVADGAATVHLRGGPDLVLVYSRSHPRGGAQPHLFGAGDDDRLREVTADGDPVVPFVATDGGAAPMTATCTQDGGIAVLTGTASQPPGVVLAWDLSQTSYEIQDAEVTGTDTSTVRRDAADPVLRKEMPELFDGSLFSDCT
jgi:hypothetical protein